MCKITITFEENTFELLGSSKQEPLKSVVFVENISSF